ncbi:Hypothetical predicted protein, partial [Mytilus galloprovincialis]
MKNEWMNFPPSMIEQELRLKQKLRLRKVYFLIFVPFRHLLSHSSDFANQFDHYETWGGNDKLHTLTSQANYELLIRMKTFENENGYARYSDFKVGDEASKFKLQLSTFTGNVGDSLIDSHNAMKFSTKDQDNDVYNEGSCAVDYKGAWWYAQCHASNLNGLYHAGDHTSYADGNKEKKMFAEASWYQWLDYNLPLKMIQS